MNFVPTHPDTELVSKYEWKPKSIEGLIAELSQIASTGMSAKKLLIYRGHRDSRWLVNSTFVRSLKTTLFGIESFQQLTNRITESTEFHQSVLSLFLLKFGVLTRPSEELEAKAEKYDLDAWFEFMKRVQQYPEEDGFFLKGTNLVDWSQSADIALYFANENRTGEGAIFVCDATATGKTLQVIPLGAILDKMNELGNSGNPLGVPLMFHPKKQIANPRPKNQQVVYFAQMDLRYDFQHIWELYEREQEAEPVYVKIILPAGGIHDIKSYLEGRGIDSKFIYPDQKSGSA